MHTSGELESYGPGHRTFDCPWCGAVSGIDPSHLGEHFTCPECQKETRLTDKNTRRGHLFEAARDAPHHPEEMRTFDCPWCGAISQVAASRLGSSYDCPECHQSTRLTSKTARRGDLFHAAPGAPHPSPQRPRWPLVAVGVLAIVVAAVVLLLPGAEEPRPESDRASTPGVSPPQDVTTAALPTPPAGAPTEETAAAEPSPEPAVDPMAEERERRLARIEAARARLESRVAALQAARQDLSKWEEDHPVLQQVLREQAARRAVQEVLQREVQRVEEQGPTAATIRASNAAIAAEIASVDLRIRVVEQVIDEMQREEVRPARVASWREVNFHLPRFGEILSDRITAANLLIPPERTRLERALADAQAERDAAEDQLAALHAEEDGTSAGT